MGGVGVSQLNTGACGMWGWGARCPKHVPSRTPCQGAGARAGMKRWLPPVSAPYGIPLNAMPLSRSSPLTFPNRVCSTGWTSLDCMVSPVGCLRQPASHGLLHQCASSHAQDTFAHRHGCPAKTHVGQTAVRHAGLQYDSARPTHVFTLVDDPH